MWHERTGDRAALEACERIQESPRPEILFADFAADALLFRVLFWVRVRLPLDLERARSELRFQIDRRFREAHITIAFPQRDVHFDHPLEIHLRRESRGDGGARKEPQGAEPSPEADE
jgi:small-conductance mechanosensitive channel